MSQPLPGAQVALREPSADEGNQREKQGSWGRQHGILEQPVTTISVTASSLSHVTFKKGKRPAALQGWETTHRHAGNQAPGSWAALSKRFFIMKRTFPNRNIHSSLPGYTGLQS